MHDGGLRIEDLVHVKICGITRLEDALLAAELGADALGLVFWPDSPRFIDPFRARKIVRALPPLVTPVGVFVDQPIAYVEGVASLVRLGAVQLHGSEGPEFTGSLSYRVIKAVPLGAGAPAPEVGIWPEDVVLLLDAHDPVRYGGTGRTVDWTAAAPVARARRSILSGGLTPDNVAGAIDAVRPYGVDVSSGVEAAPGKKDPDRLRRFFAAVRSTVGVMS